MPAPTPIDRFQTPAVQDLAWALQSPALMVPAYREQGFSADFFHQAYTAMLPQLQQLDSTPEPLIQYLEVGGRRRLGSYFERLWGYWLAHNDRYQCLAHNVQINVDGQTLGEFDLLVRDRRLNRVEHWELAVKFYLGLMPLARSDHWFGPHLKDRLDLKHRHLLHRQLKLSSQAAARAYCRQQGWEVSVSRLLSKGRLYYPLGEQPQTPAAIAPGHLRGLWLTLKAFSQCLANAPRARCYWLEKEDWLVPRRRLPVDHRELLARLGERHHPVHLLLDAWQSTAVFVFVVPDQWPDQARTCLAATERTVVAAKQAGQNRLSQHQNNGEQGP